MAKNIDLKTMQELIVRWKKAQGCGCCSDYEELCEAEDAIGSYLEFDQYEDGSGYHLHDMPGIYVPYRR